MNILSEVETVEETKHLVPNLESFSKAVFGNDSFFLDWQSNHMDWITDKVRKFDGLVWLPWKSQIWLTEVEWKKSSNFFDQSRAFAKSKVDAGKFEVKLKMCLPKIEHNLNPFIPHAALREEVISKIVNRTLETHIEDGHLRPHAWVLLGHEGPNIEILRNAYVEEVIARFKGKHYIVTMARMFTNEFSTYFLLEHTCSSDYKPNTTLVQGRINKEGLPVPLFLPPSKEDRPSVPVNIKPEPPEGSRAKKISTLLSNSFPGINIDNLRLRFKLPDVPDKYFKIDWPHKGRELLIFREDDIRKKPADVLKDAFGNRIPAKTQNVCQNYGWFYDISVTPPEPIASYAHIADAISKGISKLPLERAPLVHKPIFYFDEIDSHKQKMIRNHIVKRRRVWEVFVTKRTMSKMEFQGLSHFKSKGITGFLLFLTKNDIATRTFDDFTLNERVIPHIRKILDDHSEAT